MNALVETLQHYKNRTPVFLMHAGSANHGCEAIVASLLDLLDNTGDGSAVSGFIDTEDRPSVLSVIPVLVTNSASEDLRYSLGARVDARRLVLIEERHMDRHFFYHVAYYLWRKLTGDAESFLRFRFQPLLKYLNYKGLTPEDVIIFCIGGDNYCYPEMVPDLILANRMLHKKGFETVLVGCSVEPDDIMADNTGDGSAVLSELVTDLASYTRIIARESITYNALKSSGIPAEKLFLAPDPAFTLKPDNTGDGSAVPGFNNTGDGSAVSGVIDTENRSSVLCIVGINLSPMAQGVEKTPGVTMASYKALIRHILETGNAEVALIPHVVWESNDDRIPLRELYETFRDTGRVTLIEDHSAPKLKHIIAQCSLFIGARTHATIAAYSSGIPTLVLGYSVKSRGIATDLFKGTSVEHMTPELPAPFVLPVQQLSDPQELIRAYDILLAHAAIVKETLKS